MGRNTGTPLTKGHRGLRGCPGLAARHALRGARPPSKGRGSSRAMESHDRRRPLPADLPWGAATLRAHLDAQRRVGRNSGCAGWRRAGARRERRVAGRGPRPARASRLLRWYHPGTGRSRYGDEFAELLIADISERPDSWRRHAERGSSAAWAGAAHPDRAHRPRHRSGLTRSRASPGLARVPASACFLSLGVGPVGPADRRLAVVEAG